MWFKHLRIAFCRRCSWICPALRLPRSVGVSRCFRSAVFTTEGICSFAMLYRAIFTTGIEKKQTSTKGTNSLLQEFVKRYAKIYPGADLAPRAYPIKHDLFVVNWSGINMVNNIVGCLLAARKDIGREWRVTYDTQHTEETRPHNIRSKYRIEKGGERKGKESRRRKEKWERGGLC